MKITEVNVLVRKSLNFNSVEMSARATLTDKEDVTEAYKVLHSYLNSMVDESLGTKKEEEPKEEKRYCNECGKEVTQKIADYSKQKFKLVLCFDCQKK